MRGLMLAIGAVGGVLIAFVAAMVRRGGISEMGAPVFGGYGQETGMAGLNRVRADVETIKREVESMEQSVGSMHRELLSRMDDIRSQLGGAGAPGGAPPASRGTEKTTGTRTRRTTGAAAGGPQGATTAPERPARRRTRKSEAAVAAEAFAQPPTSRSQGKTQQTSGGGQTQGQSGR